MFKEGAEQYTAVSRHVSHLTNTLFIALRSLLR